MKKLIERIKLKSSKLPRKITINGDDIFNERRITN